MSTFGEFEHAMKLAMFHENEADYGEYVSFGDLIDKNSIEWREDWLDRLADEWEGRFARDISRVHADSRRDWSARISADGMREMEELYGRGDSPPLPFDHQRSGSDDPLLPAVISARWTGIEERVASDPAILETIKVHVREIDDLVDRAGLTNTEKAKAKAISQALIALVESPEPEWKAVVHLLTSPALTAVLNVAQIVSLIFAVFGIGK